MMCGGLSIRLMELLVVGAVLATAGLCLAQGREVVSFPESATNFTLMRDGQAYLDVNLGGWGPDWSHLSPRGRVEISDGRTSAISTVTVQPGGAVLTFAAQAARGQGDELVLDIELSSDKDTDLTYAIAGVRLDGVFRGGQVRVERADGSTQTLALPLARQGLGEQVRRFVLVDAQGRETAISLEPALTIASDGDLRIILAERMQADQPVRARLRIAVEGDLTYYAGPDEVPQEPGFERWYTWQPREAYGEPSEISLAHWLDRPAGRHGRVLRDGDQLIYNGQPQQFWGLNVCFVSCAPDPALAERRADFYARYGVNAVRLHKYADGPGWAGIQAPGSFVEFDPAGLDRMDYFIAQLKERGIYVKLSSTFTVRLGPDDRQYVPFMDEFGPIQGSQGRRGTGHGSVFLSHELQDLQIEQIVRLLRHHNPYTGLTYAEDPAIMVVELFNEDSALFHGTLRTLQRIPTLRDRAARMFFAWLQERYGTEEALLAAWGDRAINSFINEDLVGESWEEGYIHPAGNPWFFDPDQLEGSQAFRRQRLMDTMLFLYDIQNDFYDRYVQAIRDAGYEGEILASNWQAGRAFSHYYNLHSDSRIGLIDRHNYFGGGSGTRIRNETMLRTPGSGMLSTGMQQVADRPFMLSEWIHVLPSEWGVEGPALIGAYGMGLQGWDVSYMFQNRDDGGFLDKLGGQWQVSAPQIMGVFPAVARQVLRGDVAQAELVAPRYVHVPSLHEGRLGFSEGMQQDHDFKSFEGNTVTSAALAVARCLVAFTDEYRDTPAFDMTPHVCDDGRTLRSATGQLAWTAGEEALDGHFTIDTPGTQAVVGFAQGRRSELGDLAITPASRFGAIYVTARDQDTAAIADADALLVVAIARARNTGMKVYADSRIIVEGNAPLVMEPVEARIELRRPGQAVVHVLDQDGARTGRTLPVVDGAFEIDTGRDQTPYYLVSYQP